MSCPDTQQLGAWFDGELEPEPARRMAAHAETCAACRQSLAAFAAARAMLRSTTQTAPAALRARVLAALEREAAAPPAQQAPARHPRPPAAAGRFWLGAASGAAAAAVLAVAILLGSGAWTRHGTLEQLARDHVRALSGGPLIEVASTDRHTVKPWFAGRADVSPPVADFAADGYALLGGRTAPLAGQRAAVTVYRHGRHLIEVYSWLGSDVTRADEVTRRGYHIRCWQHADLSSCAISDAGSDELQGLEKLLQGVSGP